MAPRLATSSRASRCRSSRARERSRFASRRFNGLQGGIEQTMSGRGYSSRIPSCATRHRRRRHDHRQGVFYHGNNTTLARENNPLLAPMHVETNIGRLSCHQPLPSECLLGRRRRRGGRIALCGLMCEIPRLSQRRHNDLLGAVRAGSSQ